MTEPITDNGTRRPPSFEDAANPRQRVRAAGLDPDYWYAVEWARALKPGQVTQVRFWDRRIALYRQADGGLQAIEDRCLHRQLPLSLGHVRGCRLVCAYHGWAYDRGRVVDIPHDLFGHDMPRFQLRAYPVRQRYGLIWLFPGDPELAEQRRIPHIPELEGPSRWACVPVDFTWHAHHSMIIDNVSDFTHAYLHRRYRPFDEAELTRAETVGDSVFVSYDTKVGRTPFWGRFVDHRRINTNSMDLCYEYPYQWSNTDDKIKHWCFVLPIDRRTTRVFFLFYFKAFQAPLTGMRLPRAAMTPLLAIARRLLIRPLLAEDGFAVEAEQEAWERHFDAPIAELNPAVHQFQKLTVRKWREHLGRNAARHPTRRQAPAPA